MKRIFEFFFVALSLALSGCYFGFEVKESQIHGDMLVKPPISPGFYVLAEGESLENIIETVRIVRAPHQADALLGIDPIFGAADGPYKFARLGGGRFVVEINKKNGSGKGGYVYHMVEVDAVRGDVTVMIPDEESSKVKVIFKDYGFGKGYAEVSPGGKHDMVGLFKGLLVIEQSGEKIFDRSLVYRRVSEAEWNAAVTRHSEQSRLRKIEEIRENKKTRNKEDVLLMAMMEAMNATPGCDQYYVRPGDSTVRLAAAAVLSVDQLQEINPHIDIRRVAVNDRLNFKFVCKGM